MNLRDVNVNVNVYVYVDGCCSRTQPILTVT